MTLKLCRSGLRNQPQGAHVARGGPAVRLGRAALLGTLIGTILFSACAVRRVSTQIPGHASPAMLSVFPQRGFADTATITWRLPEGTRSYCIEVGDWRMSCRQADARMSQWTIQPPPGLYTINLLVEDSTGHIQQVAEVEACWSGLAFTCGSADDER